MITSRNPMVRMPGYVYIDYKQSYVTFFLFNWIVYNLLNIVIVLQFILR
jgi:hypothetical protein